ncbi:MAG: K(+)-transporting ATPase subunit C [Actinomycetota bacterium]|nr:MAG: K(+)-transporting ATPase subunit C [Actinomycetota bacterium]
MRRQLLPSLGMVLIFTVLVGLAYPLAMTGIGQLAFGDSADGQLVERDGQVVGSRLIGQAFVEPQYFHPRPSATGYTPGPGYAYGSNEGPTSERFLSGVADLVAAYREENGLADDARVPVDAVTGSGSSLDPAISVANARIQAARVAAARGLDVDEVLALVDANTDGRSLGFLGEAGVNVLELNLALDAL